MASATPKCISISMLVRSIEEPSAGYAARLRMRIRGPATRRRKPIPRGDAGLARFAPLEDAHEGDVGRRHDVDRQQRREQHPADHRDAEGRTRFAAGAETECDRQDTED